LIRHVPHNEIDFIKWDACISQADNGLIYATTAYLNIVCDNWDGIVIDNYKAVMPLPWRKKYGITYLYQPAFFPCGGVFSNGEVNEKDSFESWSLVQQHFKYAQLDVNAKAVANNIVGVKFTERRNFYLPLSDSFETIVSAFSDRLKRNLKTATKQELTYTNSTNFKDAVRIFKALYAERIKSLTEKDFKTLARLAAELPETICRTVTDNAGEVLAIAIFLFDGKRLYNIAPSVTEKGKALRANYFLYQELIREFSSNSFILDFEGSDIKGIADFYESFGAKEETYFAASYNNLPKIVKWIKE
jgi:hypothetical protein